MRDSEGDDLPVFMVDGALKAKARYPGRAELAEWAGMDAAKLKIAEQAPERGPSTEQAAAATACCGGVTRSASAKQTAGNCC
jgi:hypothetical protein